MDMSDSEARSFALTYWANYIETGRNTLSLVDCVQQAGSSEPVKLAKLFPNLPRLSDSQRRFVDRLRVLARDELKR